MIFLYYTQYFYKKHILNVFNVSQLKRVLTAPQHLHVAVYVHIHRLSKKKRKKLSRGGWSDGSYTVREINVNSTAHLLNGFTTAVFWLAFTHSHVIVT